MRWEPCTLATDRSVVCAHFCLIGPINWITEMSDVSLTILTSRNTFPLEIWYERNVYATSQLALSATLCLCYVTRNRRDFLLFLYDFGRA